MRLLNVIATSALRRAAMPSGAALETMSCARHAAAARPQLAAPRRTQLGGTQLRPRQRHAAGGAAAGVAPCRQRAAAVVVASATAPPPHAHRLKELNTLPIITTQGYILPEVPAGTQATVFAVYDEAKVLQYVGFSKDLRNSLRTVFSRRPDKAYYFSAVHLPRLEQEAMMEIRAAWFNENHGPPPGNKLPLERDAWQQPLQSTAISERGRQLASEELAKQQIARIRQRGCKEDFVPDPELLPQGLVDFLPADAVSAEELERQRAVAEAMASATRSVATSVDGAPATFDLCFRRSFPTNGGYMFDVLVTFQDKESQHRVIVGREFYEPYGTTAESVVEKAFAFLLRNKQPRQTEGLLLSSQFPINYFAISELEQHFSDFAQELGAQGEGPWRFNRTQDYGFRGDNETPEQIAAQFAIGDSGS